MKYQPLLRFKTIVLHSNSAYIDQTSHDWYKEFCNGCKINLKPS